MNIPSCHDHLVKFLAKKLKAEIPTFHLQEDRTLFVVSTYLIENGLIESVNYDCKHQDVRDALNKGKTPIILTHSVQKSGNKYVDRHKYLIVKEYFNNSSRFDCVDPKTNIHQPMDYGDLVRIWFYNQHDFRVNRVMMTTKKIYARQNNNVHIDTEV